jgi:hypothetical protein
MCGQTSEPAATANIAQAVRVDHAPRLDGTLDDPIWQQALPITDFKQREPYEGQPATERTEVRVLYTRNEFYFGIACHDSVANGSVATQLRRDVTQELDDYFEIVIDSRFDRRNAYVFQVNPLGTQRDALITDEQVGQTQDGDPGWDGVWSSEARRTHDGWTATIAIPFSTLNFMRSRDVVWGVNFKRFIRRKNEEDLWSGWRRTFGASKISQAGELHGITEIGSGRLLIVKPYALGGFSHLPPNATASGLTPGTTGLYTGGVDVKIGLRSNLVANFTVNTDFADSDSDVQQFNLTPYDTIIEFANPELKLFPGMTAYVTIPVATAQNVLKLPNTALRYKPPIAPEEILASYKRYGIEGVQGDDHSVAAEGGMPGSTGPQNLPRAPKPETAVVWRLHSDNTMEPVKVSLGITDHAYTEVSSVLTGELKESDDVIIRSVAPKTSALGSLRR